MTTKYQKVQPNSPRRQHTRDNSITAILDSARLIMREKGAAALSMQELARRMDMRAPSLYNYFSGLMDIYDALFRMGFMLWGERINKLSQAALTWQDEIRLLIEAYMTFAMENPELYQLCFERPVPGFVPSEESMQLSRTILHNGYSRVAGLQDRLDTNMSAEQASDLVIAIMHGLTALHMANEPHLPLGQGRFGSLIPNVVSLLEKAWSKEQL